MDRIEFLEKLRQALEMNVSSQVIQENLDYYSQYISDEMRKGRSEQEIMDELGDPWIIARTIIGTYGDDGSTETIYDTPQQEYRTRNSSQERVKVFRFDSWWKKLLLALCIVAGICLIFAVISGIISLIAPILIPLFIIMIVVRILRGRS